MQIRYESSKIVHMENTPLLDRPEPTTSEPKNQGSSPAFVLALLFGLMAVLSLLFIPLLPLIAQVLDLNPEKTLEAFGKDGFVNDAAFMRVVLFFNHLLVFILPALGVAAIVSGNKMFEWLRATHEPKRRDVLWGILMLVVSIPLVQVLYWLNAQIPLPDSLAKMSQSNEAVLKVVLQSDNILQTLGILALVAVMPAIGEEFVFRGIIQQQLLRLLHQRPHVAIWLSAAIFSAIHFQFEGFFARMILGAVLGYLFYWTNNIWVSAAAHFFNNALQLFLYFQSPDALDTDKSMAQMNQYWYVAIPLAVLSALLLVQLSKQFTQLPKQT
jgi:uncharacterized protein